jgi:formate C-acetyltransferase
MLATGIGDPAFFNDHVISAGLRDHGVSEVDSCNYMNSTCVEIKVVGASNMWVTTPYFNCPQALLDVLDQIANGSAEEPANLHQLNEMVKGRLEREVRDAAHALDQTWKARAETACFPLASCFISDCLERGLDFDRGGARYNWVENSFVGLANLVDGLFAIKRLVYDQGELSLAELHAALNADFHGYEELQGLIVQSGPYYGTDRDEVDAMAVEWAEFLQDTTESNSIGGHRYVPGFFCWIMHEHFGSSTGATPDGRHAGLPLADGAGAAQGRENAGPTASILSTTKWSHQRVLGGLVQNLKFSQSALADERGITALRSLIETYLGRGGFEIQVNVVSTDTLRDAQAHPESYQDLVVRVAGYSDYFVHLNPKMQEEVIARTEHGTIGKR